MPRRADPAKRIGQEGRRAAAALIVSADATDSQAERAGRQAAALTGPGEDTGNKSYKSANQSFGRLRHAFETICSFLNCSFSLVLIVSSDFPLRPCVFSGIACRGNACLCFGDMLSSPVPATKQTWKSTEVPVTKGECALHRIRPDLMHPTHVVT